MVGYQEICRAPHLRSCFYQFIFLRGRRPS